MTSTSCTALAAAATATVLALPLSDWLINAQGHSSGIGAGIARPPSPLLLLLFVTAATLGAAALSTLPATRASHRRQADTLSAVA